MNVRMRFPRPLPMRRWRPYLIMLALTALVAGLTAPMASPAARAATQAATVSLTQSTVEDTASGAARTLNVPGGGYAVLHSFGEVSMVSAAGTPQWQLDTQQLYQDWNLTWQQPVSPVTQVPQIAWGTDPANPLNLAGPAEGLVNDVNPAATGVLNGRPVVAVAETVGVPMTKGYVCGTCTWPFSVPGSSLNVGTFVSVVDARTGQMVYHELDPGYVTQVAIAANRLIVGDENGNPRFQGGIGQWGGVSTVRAVTFSSDGKASQAWRYSTGVPWGRLLDVAVTGGAGGSGQGIAIAWSDTPSGLGVPGPPDGHVLLLDAASGSARWQVRTPGYPTLTAADDQRGELAVVQQADPAFTAGYTLTGLSYATGQTVMSDKRNGAIPFSLAVGAGSDDGWAVGAADASVGDSSYNPTDARVTLANPATGRDLWSVTLPQSQYGTPLANGLLVTKGAVIAAAWFPFSGSPAVPVQQYDSLTAFDYQTGHTDWRQAGDTGDPVSLSAVADGPGLFRAVTSHQAVETYGAGGQATHSTAGPGDFLTGVTASVAAPGSTDLVAGNEDGDVYAFDGKALAAGTQRVLWRTDLPGPVQQVETTTIDGRQVVVAAATSAIGLLDASTGRLLRLIQTPGTYTYSATVISASGTPAVVVPGRSLTAYSLTTGARLWSRAAPSGAWFSGAAYAHGVVAAEYSSAISYGSDGVNPAAEMAAVGVSAATGSLAWSAPADPSVVLRGQLYNGAFASPDIAGASGDGVAFIWQDTNGQQVDVRNITTGALDYSDTSDDLSAFSQFLASPGLGLIAVSLGGSALITPAGAESSYSPQGTSGALATTTSGQQALLTADNGVWAYGTDIFTTSSASLEASAGAYLSGTLVAGDFAGNGSQQVAAMAGNWFTDDTVGEETGTGLEPNYTHAQYGLAMLTLRDASASSSAAKTPAAAAGTARAPHSTVRPGSAASEPAALKPVGQPGSQVPTLEPVRSGAAQPDTSLAPDTSTATLKRTMTADGADPAGTPLGYSPSQLTAYLGLTGDGKGQTVAIVDAYNDPDIVSDTETFSQQFGLPGVCGSGGTPGDCFTLDVREQSATAGSDQGWGTETSLDVEWAHALAPDATIELIEARDSSFASLFRGVTEAAAARPAAISMSWGYLGGEFSDEAYYDHFCAVSTTVCLVAAGDSGHPGSYPAYNPAALAVGGTTLNLTASGAVTSEQSWSGSGGGRSWVEPEPAYQDPVQSSGMREMPDVAYDADQNTGVAVYDTDGWPGWMPYPVGGTSVGAPSWAGILADADQLRAGTGEPPLTAAGYAAQRAVYSLPATALAPVTSGPANGFCPDGCAAGPGYDEITGMGSPRAGIDTALATAKG